MTVQPADTDTLIDVAALVGEMDAVPCEHTQHGTPGLAHDDGPATHYAQGCCPSCGYLSAVTPVCATFVAFVQNGGHTRCMTCEVMAPASQRTRILGPVN